MPTVPLHPDTLADAAADRARFGSVTLDSYAQAVRKFGDREDDKVRGVNVGLVSTEPAPPPRRTRQYDDAPQLQTVPGIQILAVGDQQDGKAYTAADLDEIAANFARLRDLLQPTLVIPTGPAQLASTGIPAFGTVIALRHAGSALIADFGDVLPKVARQIRAGSFAGVECELYPDFEDQGQHYGLTLRRVILHGGALPKVQNLSDMPWNGFGERIAPGVYRDGRGTYRRYVCDLGRAPDGEAGKVRRFAEANREELHRLFRQTPQMMADAFAAARRQNPDMTAAEFCGG